MLPCLSGFHSLVQAAVLFWVVLVLYFRSFGYHVKQKMRFIYLKILCLILLLAVLVALVTLNSVDFSVVESLAFKSGL